MLLMFELRCNYRFGTIVSARSITHGCILILITGCGLAGLVGCEKTRLSSPASPNNQNSDSKEVFATEIAPEPTAKTNPDRLISNGPTDNSIQAGAESNEWTPDAPAALSSRSVPEADSFTVMTWNLEWFFDDFDGDNFSKLAKDQTAPSRAQWDWKRDAVAASIHSLQPSVVALQEIEGRRVLWYLAKAMERNHAMSYREICIEGDDVFTEQDVGFIYRSDTDDGKSNSPEAIQVEPTLASVFGRTAAMKRDDLMADVSKHLAVEYEIVRGDDTERVTVFNLHLRAREEAIAVRTKQARTVHAWLASKIRAGENVIVLGDFNAEDTTIPAEPTSDMAAVCGLDTGDSDDDLVDLLDRLPIKSRQTHLLSGKAFDRILVSPSLLIDDPNRVDLVLAKFERLPELNVKGSVDVPQEHWDSYWQISDDNRDISDHWPLMATFDFK